MGYTFRTPGPWGPGIGVDLTPNQVDSNFWQAIQDITAKAAQGVGISNIVVNGDQMTVVLTDHSLLGPYTLPTQTLQFRGEWLPNTAYLAGDIITHAGSTYIVNINHTSAATFDPGANIGGNDIYGLLLNNPALTIPPGGATGAFLRKLSVLDWAYQWMTAALGDLSDVSLTVSPGPATGDVLTFNGANWVASPITQLSLALEDLTDVTIPTSPPIAAGQILTWNGSVWTNSNPAFNTTLVGVTSGQVLVYDFTAGAWLNKNTADIPVYGVGALSGTISLNYANGGVQRLSVVGGTTLDHVSNWPLSGQFGRMVLEITNTGAYTFTWPPGYHWPGGAAPILTPSGRDIFTLTTFSGGSSVDGSVIGQGYI